LSLWAVTTWRALEALHNELIISNRSQVQGSKFRVKGKEGIENPKCSFNMVVFQRNCQFGSKFWIRPVKGGAFYKYTFQIQSGNENGILNPGRLRRRRRRVNL